ncbi:unnamed protein product [Parascedosporium putredinis]|uniref:RNA helicase n=1 Tax=Parascedosporium putredinis TaxID=1442378 RepID=A0A9P1M992_9PEZI|nr:unnamed protein product [Parascedosporium putredinis]CAI7995254.1 unnamed protein product [Parascedosporium putredinis]
MSWPPLLQPRLDLPISEEDDKRIASSHDNSTGEGTLSKVKVDFEPSDSASLASLFSTLVPVLVYAGVCILIFWCLRHRLPRVYSPRTILTSLLPQERSSPLPKTWFTWVKPFFQLEDTIVLHHTTLDAYLFLRYLKILSLICFVGCCIIWPVLLPLHAHGGGNNTELDRLTIGNVTESYMFMAHVVVACCFFGFIIFTIYRECIFYINLRHAYLLSPYQSKRLSSRTVMFLSVPERYLDEARLRKVYGDGVKNVWIPRDTEDFEKLVKERDQTARRLEKAEIRLIKMADARRRKQAESPQNGNAPLATPASDATPNSNSNPNPTPTPTPISIVAPSPALVSRASDDPSVAGQDDVEKAIPRLPDVNGSVAAQWIRARERPHHRPVANFFRRVDTIKWTRNRLKVLNPAIRKMKRRLLAGEGKPLPAAFIEFTTQAEAERAYQIQAHHSPMHMSPRFIGVRPDELIWSVIQMGWAQRIVRRFVILAAITAGIIFWSFPAAFVGLLSNITFLAETFPFLSWIVLLPKALKGVIQGFLPALCLSLLMAAVPWMLRGCARAAGIPSLSMIELFVQNAYFAFQVVQVFLITTITSAASGAVTAILKDPMSVKDLLSENLPKSSNFYISYILMQCLAAGANALVHVFEIVRHHLMSKRLESPRMKFTVWHRVRRIHWGGVFPVFTNMGVISISYACISPLVLGFASAGMYVIYLVYRYNLLYIYNTEIDTRGLVYPRALMQLLVGVYLAEICMIGLFALRSAFVPMVVMIAFLVLSLKGPADAIGLTAALGYVNYWIRPDRTVKPNFVLRWLHPGIFDDFVTLQKMLPPNMPDPTEFYPEDYTHHAYWPPVMTTPMETLWIPRDKGGVSRQEVKHSSEVIDITDEGAWLDKNGRVERRGDHRRGAPATKVKKDKKDKKDKKAKKAKKEKEAKFIDDAEVLDPVEDVVPEVEGEKKKKDKKEKKDKKDKKEKKDKKDKKEKKRKEETEEENAEDRMEIDDTPAEEATSQDSDKKASKKKKRKHDEVAEDNADRANGPDVADTETKPKKKSKKEGKGQNGAEANGSAAPTSTPAKASKASQGSYVESTTLAATSQSDVDSFLKSKFITITDPTGKLSHLRPIMEFSHLPSTRLLQKSPFKAFSAPTPIQAASWPFTLSDRDVIGVAETGSGKTMAFALPCVEGLSKNSKRGGIRAVIVSPTRELAMQTHEQVSQLAGLVGLSCVCVYGGAAKYEQRSLLSRGADIVVATPGRLKDFMSEGVCDLSGVQFRTLSKSWPPRPREKRQTLMFTATWPLSVQALAASMMVNPVRINISNGDEDRADGELQANKRITQRVEVVDPRAKEARLLQILREYQQGSKKNDRILVFALYKKEATRVEETLARRGISVAGIHGDLRQEQRTKALEAFKAGTTSVLVATDVAARGLDIPEVKLVVNLTFPLTIEDYVHRIGRTGRAGKTGEAITLFTLHDKSHSGELINILRQAGQPVPEDLLKFGTTVKKKLHPSMARSTAR